jgi:hypothetical protein
MEGDVKNQEKEESWQIIKMLGVFNYAHS